MDEYETNSESSAAAQCALSRAIRVGFASIAAGLSYPNIWIAFHVQNFQQIYHDMMGNRPIPGMTAFLYSHQGFCEVLSILFPLTALAGVFIPGNTRSIYISSFITLGLICQLLFVWPALLTPLLQIVQGMANN